MTVDEALKYIISMGVVAPPHTPESSTNTLNQRKVSCVPITADNSMPPSTARSSPLRLGASSPRPRRRHLHRPARPRRSGPGRLRPGSRRDVRDRRIGPQRVLPEDHRQGAPRPAGTTNANLASGEIEILCHEIEVLNPAVTPPFQLDEDNLSENVRLTHRVIDLRRPQMQNNLMLRYKTARAFRRFLDDNGFIDIETPMLTKSTPEGARDYLVPSRVHPGQFFALPQSPQLFKQLLMVAGLRPLLPDRQVLPRRRPARRPPAGIHPGRYRNLFMTEDEITA
jgi:hypothetical protein